MKRRVLERADFDAIKRAFLAVGLPEDYLGFYDILNLHQQGRTVDEIIDAGLHHAELTGALPKEQHS